MNKSKDFLRLISDGFLLALFQILDKEEEIVGFLRFKDLSLGESFIALSMGSIYKGDRFKKCSNDSKINSKMENGRDWETSTDSIISLSI
ncbi:hypothetical protein KKA24_00815 [Patescibacteria group bacterium]|nr:hypothetical protein [Patescibacteria group bacterium]